MIEEHIAPEMGRFARAAAATQGDLTRVDGDTIFPVLNMLNVKYGIMGQEGRETFPVPNPHAYGNGWFVKDVRYVANADEEILGLHQVNPKETALVAEKYKDVLGGTEGRQPVDSLSTVKLDCLRC